MTDTREELRRLVDLLPQTDPTSDAYLTLLRSIECLSDIAESIDDFIKDAPVLTVLTKTEPEAETEPEPTEPEPDTGYSEDYVRAELTKAKLAGKDIKSALESVGAHNFSGVDPKDYGKLLLALGE